MSKSVLGRGLGNLLGSSPTPGQNPAPQQPNLPGTEPKPGPGLGRLLRGGTGPAREVSDQPLFDRPVLNSPPPALPVPLWLLWVADLVLLGLAATLVWRHPTRLSAGETVLCVMAVALGAALACTALLKKS